MRKNIRSIGTEYVCSEFTPFIEMDIIQIKVDQRIGNDI